jgi:hypothetical protein
MLSRLFYHGPVWRTIPGFAVRKYAVTCRVTRRQFNSALTTVTDPGVGAQLRVCPIDAWRNNGEIYASLGHRIAITRLSTRVGFCVGKVIGYERCNRGFVEHSDHTPLLLGAGLMLHSVPVEDL